MRVAVSQKKCLPGNIQVNISDCLNIIKAAREGEADLVVFPELSDTGYELNNISSDVAGYKNESPLGAIQKAAVKSGIAVVAGLTELSEFGLYNTAVAIDKEGAVIARYRKIHLYTPNGEGVFTPGNEPVLFEFMGFRFGVNICYDIRFPEFSRHLFRSGMNVLIVPTAWPFPRVEHWNLLTRARAIENQCYVIGANRVGTDAGFTFCGNSRIVDPHGVMVASASEDQEELIFGNIDHSRIDFVRNRQPIRSHMRGDLF